MCHYSLPLTESISKQQLLQPYYWHWHGKTEHHIDSLSQVEHQMKQERVERAYRGLNSQVVANPKVFPAPDFI